MNPKKLARLVLPNKGIRLAEETYRKGRIYGLQARFGFPARGLRVIAVTGTNGKTTTCCYINQILKAAGYKTAMYSTALIEIKGKCTPNTTHRTLPLTEQLLKFFRSARKAKVDFVVLEVTSQALHQHKLIGIPTEVAVWTNLSQDHLDYHGTMDNYAKAKARLFNRYMSPKFCVLNADEEYYDYFLLESVGQVVSYGKSTDSTERMSNIKPDSKGVSWRLVSGNNSLELSTRLAGTFNAYNATAAAAVGLTLGIDAKVIKKGIEALKTVPGRMEAVEAGQPFAVWVDYAVTPDALQKVLEAARGAAKNKVAIVFGATGNRDREKRPIMGNIAAKFADKIYLTDDETYTEDPDVIRQSVYEGIKYAKGTGKTKVIPDRKKAIKAAFDGARRGDVVVLTGIGHQDSRNMGGKLLPWDEKKIAEKLLKK